MNESDKIEIDGLINSLTEMTKLADKSNEKYMDYKTAKFASDAKTDYQENKAYIAEIINNNLELFFNYNRVCIFSHKKFLDDDMVLIPFSNGLRVVASVNGSIHPQSQWNASANDYIVTGLWVRDIYCTTSDTKNPEYNICCCENLIETHGEKSLNVPIDEPRTAKGWEYLYRVAVRTQEMNKILVKYFKSLLKSKISSKKSFADTNQQTRNSLEDVGVYVKVSI